MDEVGIVSYYTKDRVLDIAGLADAHLANLPGAPGTRSDPNYVFGQEPRYIFILFGVPSDSVYLRDPRIFAYRLAADVYQPTSSSNPRGNLYGLLFERWAPATGARSLDHAIPSQDKRDIPTPGEIGALLSREVATGAGVTPAPPDVQASGPLPAWATLTAVTRTTEVSIHTPARSDCLLEATALSIGSAQLHTLTLTASGGRGTRIGQVNEDLGYSPAIRTGRLSLPPGQSLRVTFSADPNGDGDVAWWVEPRIVCR
jgi:hypothetical protein